MINFKQVVIVFTLLSQLIYCPTPLEGGSIIKTENTTITEEEIPFLLDDIINEKFRSIHSEYVEVYVDNIDFNINTPLDTLDGVNLNISDFNDHIEANSPADSPFIDQGEIFVEIGKYLNINPYYIYAHASLESGHGKSRICIDKGNYFGIGAFNSDPYNCALTFDGNNMAESIYYGAKWIKENYFDKNQNTLYSMLYGGKKYAVNNDGSPNDSWAYKILSLMK